MGTNLDLIICENKSKIISFATMKRKIILFCLLFLALSREDEVYSDENLDQVQL